MISSFAPGAAATKYWNACECPSTVQRAPPPSCLPSHSSSACCGSIVIAHRSVGELDLLLGAHAVARERARHPVLLGDLADDRPPARPRGRQPERRGDRRLADAALAGHVEHRAIAQQCVHRSHPRTNATSWTRRCSEGYETSRRMLRRHDPTYYFATRRLPAELRPATHALYGYVRTADQIVDGPRRPATPDERRAALDAWEAELEAGRVRQPIVRALADAAARHRLPLGELRTYMRSMRIDCAPGADRHLGGARRLHGRLGRLGRADHGRAARRSGAPPCRPRPPRPRVPARELHPRRARGPAAGPHLPARRGPRALRRQRGRPRAPTPPARGARAARPRGRARPRPVRGRPARRSPPRPPPCAPASASRSGCTAACSTASRRRLRRPRPPTGVRVWHLPGAALEALR